MALITCKNCGKEVSDKAKVCPGCGCVLIEEIPQPEPAEESTPSVRICEECGHEFPYDAESCPNCGCPVEPPADSKEEAPGDGSSEPQKVEITKVNLPGMKAKAKKIIAIVAVLAVLIAVATVVIIKNNAKKNKEEYMSNLRLASSTMLSGATEAESCGSLIHDVWYNCIFEKSDTETDQYTRTRNGMGDYYDDFNDALGNLFNDVVFTLRINELKSNQSEVADLMKKLKEPPEEYRDAYDALKDFHEAYQELMDLAINPTGNLTSYTQNFNSADSDVVKYYKALKIYLD